MTGALIAAIHANRQDQLVIPTSLVGNDSQTYNPPFVTQASVTLTLNNDGTYTISTTAGTSESGNWINPTSAAGNYEVNVSTSGSGGSWSGSPTGSYIALSTSRSWTFTVSGPASGSGSLSFDIRRVGSGSPSRSGSLAASASCL